MSVVAPVPPLATGSVPVTPVPRGSPVRLVAMPEAGVPRAGLIRVGEVFITNVLPVPVCEAMAVELPTLVIGPVRFALVVTVAALPVVELELPVILPTMGLVTVRLASVPTLVKLV